MALGSNVPEDRRNKMPPCSAVIAAAGASRRMGGEDKLFADICGAPVLAHSLAAFQNCGYINEIVVVTREDKLELVGAICRIYSIGKASKIIVGGPTRQESVLLGVLAVSKKARLIAIHDGARPCADMSVISGAVEAAAKFHAAAPGVPVSSTVKRAKSGIVTGTVDRDGLFEIQTPQVFAAELIKAALTSAVKKGVSVTDDCMAAELIGAPIRITEGSRYNIKITAVEDLAIAKAILAPSSGGISTTFGGAATRKR